MRETFFMPDIRAMQEETSGKGELQINVTSTLDSRPIAEARISISYTGVPEQTLEQVTTDSSGQSEVLTLDAPPEAWSLDPNNERQPYSEYTLDISAPGFEPVSIAGTEILANVKAIQNVRMRPSDTGGEEEEVFDGSPRDTTATNYYVKYKDYIKNVASSEIYATWPADTIRANVLAIMSFTLNRVYTEWYRNRGYDFTITSSTAFDHKWIPERNFYDTISVIVDELFAAYLSRPNVRQPILTQYCDGRRVICPNWMTQWGSKELGDRGYSPIEILRYFYGDDMYINSAEEISGIPASWPGYTLEEGSSGAKVRQMQEQLNVIAEAYPALPKITADGIYGPATANAVKEFQSVFGLPATGKVDYPTWYKISEIYVGVSRIAELT